MNTLAAYAASGEIATSLHRKTGAALLNLLATAPSASALGSVSMDKVPTIEVPVSGDMLAVLRRDTDTRIRKRRARFHLIAAGVLQ